MNGLKRLSTLCACCLLFLTAARSAPADFVGIAAGVRSDLTICQDTTQDFLDEPLTVCNFFAVFDDPADELLSTGNADITTTAPAGFFQHPFNVRDIPPPCALFPSFPALVCDSFVAIGLECENPSDGDDCGGYGGGRGSACTHTNPDFDSDEFNDNGHLVGGWFNSNPSNGQGDAGNYADNLVLCLQVATSRGESTSGDIDVFWSDTDGEIHAEVDVFLECPGPCPGDLNFDDAVGAEDLAQLLGNWGPCAGCPADLNGDGVVGSFDLPLLLGAWGPCL